MTKSCLLACNIYLDSCTLFLEINGLANSDHVSYVFYFSHTLKHWYKVTQRPTATLGCTRYATSNAQHGSNIIITFYIIVI